jgi:hypothetical protein
MYDPIVAQAKPSQTGTAASLFDELRAILEELAGGVSMQPIIEQVRSLYSLSRNDARLQTFLIEVRQYLTRVLNEPAVIERDAEVQMGRSLLHRGTGFAMEYRDSAFVRQLVRNVEQFIEAIRSDPTNARLARALRELGSELYTEGSDGKRVINTEALSQLRTLLVPMVLDQLNYIPIPLVEGKSDDGTYDYRFENIVLSGYDIAPDHVRMRYDNDMDFNFKDLSMDKNKQAMYIKIQNIKLNVKDVKFWFRRNSVPHVEDAGLANVLVGGDGMSVSLHMKLSTVQPYFATSHIRCHIDTMKVRITEAKHQHLMNMATTLFGGVIRKRTERAIEEKLAEIMVQVEAMLNRLGDQARAGAHQVSAQTKESVMPAISSAVHKAINTAQSSTTGTGAGASAVPAGYSGPAQ